MNKTKIDWADSTWNPVTGCEHGCSYCYARGIALRFGHKLEAGEMIGRMHLLREKIPVNPYPYLFEPTFHPYKLIEPQWYEKPRTIFVGSMCDLFGEWVPDEVIEAVFKACREAPQHRYLFLTKNPARYIELAKRHRLPGTGHFWYGTTITGAGQPYFASKRFSTFLSIEPMLEDFADGLNLTKTKWVIVGAKTGNAGPKIVPEKLWIEKLIQATVQAGVPLFEKTSLAPVMGKRLIQEYPWKMWD